MPIARADCELHRFHSRTTPRPSSAQDLSEQLDASDSAKAERRLEHSVDRAMQERGQLGHLAAAHKIVSGFAEALKEPRRDSFLNRISASSFGL